MNTTYKSQIKPQFDGIQPQDATLDLSQPKQMLESLGKGLEQEAKTLQDIALDEAQISFNRGAAELVDKYGTDFKGLDDAMMKLENESYQKFAQRNPALATKLLKQQDAVRLRAVDAAHKTYIKVNNEKIKSGSSALLDSFKIALPDDFANYLYQKNLPEEEQDLDVIGQWENSNQQIKQLLNRRDMEGNYIFSETDRKNLANLNKYKMQGAKTFIDGMELEQLKKWDSDTFQNEKAFREMTEFDKDEYNQLDTYIKNRRKALDKEDERKIKTQAAFNLAEVLGSGNADAKLDALRNQGVLPKKLIDKVEDLDKKIIESHWYDPNKESDPMGLINAISELGELARDNDYSPDGMLKKIELGTNIENRVYDNQKITNMSDDDLKMFRNMLQMSITDQTFNNMWMLDLSYWTDELKLDMLRNPADYPKGRLQEYEKEEEKYHSVQRLTPAEEKIQKRLVGYSPLRSWFTSDYNTFDNARRMATIGAVEDIREIQKQVDLGHMETASAMLRRAKYDYAKKYNSYWIPESEFDRLQAELEAGKKPIYFHKGVAWEYLGVEGKTMFSPKLWGSK